MTNYEKRDRYAELNETLRICLVLWSGKFLSNENNITHIYFMEDSKYEIIKSYFKSSDKLTSKAS